MANRRMFSKEVVDSDAFLDMPQTTQLLYFHLGMRADDEGFISSPKKILRVVGSNQNDLDLLLAKNYVICFDSGIMVVKHWKLNNSIRKDRLKETVYFEEKILLDEKENGVYTLNSTSCIDLQPSDNQVTTICPPSIVEDSIEEISIVASEEAFKKPTKKPTENVNNFKKWTVEEFTKEISENGVDYSSEMKNAFFAYWTEPNTKGKMKFQSEKFWCTSRRLSTWFNRSK